MGNRSQRTEHSGPKKGRGAYYGRKRAAKRDSGKRRRQQDTTGAAQTTSCSIEAVLEQDPVRDPS